MDDGVYPAKPPHTQLAVTMAATFHACSSREPAWPCARAELGLWNLFPAARHPRAKDRMLVRDRSARIDHRAACGNSAPECPSTGNARPTIGQHGGPRCVLGTPAQQEQQADASFNAGRS